MNCQSGSWIRQAWVKGWSLDPLSTDLRAARIVDLTFPSTLIRRPLDDWTEMTKPSDATTYNTLSLHRTGASANFLWGSVRTRLPRRYAPLKKRYPENRRSSLDFLYLVGAATSHVRSGCPR